MFRSTLLRGVSAGALIFMALCRASDAQELLPAIDIGAAAPTDGGGGSAGGEGRNLPGGAKDPTAYSKPDSSVATKTDTPIMQTPAVVTVVPQQVLRDQQAVTIDDALQNVSGVYAISVAGLQSGFQIRGFDSYSYFIDGVRVQNQSTPIAEETADIQQIEVLKGPASILYGRIEPGGLIELTTKKPLDTPYNSVQQQFGSYSFYRTTVDSTGPLTEDKSLLYRFNFAYENAQSFREFQENRRVFLAPRVHWAPTQDTEFDFYLRYLNGMGPLDSGTPNIVDSNYRPIAVAPAPRSRNYGEPGSQSNNYHVRAGLKWTHAFNADWSLTQRLDAYFIHDLGYVLLPFDAQCFDTCSLGRVLNNPDVTGASYFTSLELKGHFDTFGIGHSILAGHDFFSDRLYTNRSFNFNVPAIDLFFPVHTGIPYYLLATPDTRFTINLGQSWHGLYFQDQVTLPFDFHLLAGFRYDTARSFGVQEFTVPEPRVTSAQKPASAITPRIGLLWQPIPQLSLFGDYVEGFGAQSLFDGGGAPNTSNLDPQRSRQWEGGVKVSLMDGRLMGTAAWFDIVKTNIPTPSTDPILAAEGVQVATGAVRNRGVDFDVSGQLTPELKLIGSFAYIDSKIIADNNGNVGHRYYGVPRFGGSLWAVYEPQWEPLRGWTVGAGFFSRSNFELDNANSFLLSGFTTVNAMARYAFMYDKTKVSLQLNVNNLLDKTYFTTLGGGANVFPGTPRTFMGSVRVEF